jgi:hypothetical protein
MTDPIEPTATFIELADLKPQPVRSQRHPDGSERSVWDRWFVMSQDPPLVVLHTAWEPEVIVHRHGHLGHHGVYVLKGGMWCEDRWCGIGTYIDLPLGAAAGPYRAGPQGVELFELTVGDGRSWESEPESFVKLLAERGITPLPNREIDLPPWIEDSRSDQTRFIDGHA